MAGTTTYAGDIAIRRDFIDVGEIQVHYRACGNPNQPTLVMLHSGPGASSSLVPLMRRMARARRVLAFDIPGFGDSPALGVPQPEIVDFADALADAVDALAVDRFDAYGTHTGANIAAELAIRWPERIRHLIFDGIALYSPDMRADLLANYARHIEPDLDGAYLMKVWHFVRDQSIFWPWFRRDADHLRDVGLPSAEALHDLVVEVLRAVETYHLGYRASFRYRKEDRLPLIRTPTLFAGSPSDIFFAQFDEVASLVPGASKLVTPLSTDSAYLERVAERFIGFLDDHPAVD